MKSRDQIWVEGYVVRDPARRASNFRSERSLDDDLVAGAVVADIRRRHSRDNPNHSRSRCNARRNLSARRSNYRAVRRRGQRGLLRWPVGLSASVSVKDAYVIPAVGQSIGALAVLDLGVKNATLGHLGSRFRGSRVASVSDTRRDSLHQPGWSLLFERARRPERFERHVEILRGVLDKRIPFFGICFGNQLLGRALGFETYKLNTGHRGINQPVLDKKAGRIEITAHNHGFAVNASTDGVIDSPSGFGG